MAITYPNVLRRRAKPVQHEKIEQQHGENLLVTLGAKVYRIGTRRSRGKNCPKCGTFVPEDQGTRQTPGIADVFAFLPYRGDSPDVRNHTHELLVWEAKASAGHDHRAGTASPEQCAFAALCQQARISHVTGGLPELTAWLIGRGYLKADNVPHYRRPANATTR